MNLTERNLEEQARKRFNDYLSSVITEELTKEIKKQAKKIAKQMIAGSVISMWETSNEYGIRVQKK